jgi:phosphate transport system ATP-binding protein
MNIDRPIRLETENVGVYYGTKDAVRNVNVAFRSNTVNALIGPSGCGKTTFLRAINRMHELTPNTRVTGKILLDGQDVYDKDVDPVDVRRRIGMVFQKPNPFPTMSIYDNVVAGLRLAGERNKTKLDETVERSLRGAALWDEVKDRLKAVGSSLSGGQQQRLCIARALAVEPEILLMDEPTSALDPQSTQRIEDLMESLKQQTTIIIVTHNMQQASRVSDTTSFFLVGDLVEHGATEAVFQTPKDERTEAYITGRFG